MKFILGGLILVIALQLFYFFFNKFSSGNSLSGGKVISKLSGAIVPQITKELPQNVVQTVLSGGSSVTIENCKNILAGIL